MPFEELEVLFEDLGSYPTKEQLTEMLNCFTSDFVINPFQVKGCNVKVILKPSYDPDFRGYPETFVHLITRENKYKDKREFDAYRASRIHWIKPILLNHESPQIKYYEFPDKKGVIKHHYWFEAGNFLVVLKPISLDLIIVTAFCVDKNEVPKIRSRYNAFKGSL